MNLSHLMTEQQNPSTEQIDAMSTWEMLAAINQQDMGVPLAVQRALPAIEKLVDAAYKAVSEGGHILYIGAGTSGRLGVLDASECPPTYGVAHEVVQGIIAGGTEAMFFSREGAEDSQIAAEKDLLEHNITKKDIVIGLAASGRTPYVIHALEYAQSIGAATGSICCVENGEISKQAEYPVEVLCGPEVITGSTRMKAGTAEKLVLNMISTSVMIKMGKVYKNYMVDVQPTNEKLEVRAQNMIKHILEVSPEKAHELYEGSHKNVKTALVMGILEVDCQEAQDLLQQAHGRISEVINKR